MFGYSISRPVMSKGYFHDIYDKSLEAGCPIEGWHTESGPGVYEAVRFHLEFESAATVMSRSFLLTLYSGLELCTSIEDGR